MSDFYPLINIKVGDLVVRTTASDEAHPYKVLSTTAGRFVVDIGNGQTRLYRKQDGKSVGDKWHVTYVRRCCNPPQSDAGGESSHV